MNKVVDVTDILGSVIFADDFMLNALENFTDEELMEQYALNKNICYKVLEKYPHLKGFLAIDTYKFEFATKKDIRQITEFNEKRCGWI